MPSPRTDWRTIAAIASCLVGATLLLLPSVWDPRGSASAARPDAAAPASPPAAQLAPRPPSAPAGSGSAIAPAPELPTASAENQAKALQLAQQAKALLDQYSGDPRLLEQASELIAQALNADGRSAEALIEQSRFIMKSGGALRPTILTAAETPLRHSLAYHPDHGNTLVLLGYVLTHQRRFDEATAAFDTARRVKADSPWLDLNNGELLLLQGRFEDGLDRYQAAIEDPKVPRRVKDWATEEMSRQLAKMGRGDQAVAAYEKLITSGRSRAWTYGHYSRVLRVNLIDTRRSVEMGREALKRMDYGWGRDNLGRSLYLAWAEALIEEKNKAKARQLYAEAQEYVPDAGVLLDEIHEYPRAHPIVAALKQQGYSLNTFAGSTIGTNDTPLTMAAKSGNEAIAKQLLDAGADPDVVGGGGGTALMYATYFGHPEVIRLLLKRGANPWLRDPAGTDAEAVAQRAGKPEAAQLLAAAKKDKPRSAFRKIADANGLPVTGERYRTRGVVPANGPWRAIQSGEVVVFKGANGRMEMDGRRVPDGLWLTFLTDKREEVTWKQDARHLDWQQMFELAPES